MLDRVRSLVAEGQGLIDSSQILDDSIAAKCSELEKASENLTRELKDKQTMLTQVMDLHKRLDMVTRNTYMRICIYICIYSTFQLPSFPSSIQYTFNCLILPTDNSYNYLNVGKTVCNKNVQKALFLFHVFKRDKIIIFQKIIKKNTLALY